MSKTTDYPAMSAINLTESEHRQIVEILSRRANEIAHYSGEVPESVDLALEREIKRLRSLADKVLTGIKEDEDEDDSK